MVFGEKMNARTSSSEGFGTGLTSSLSKRKWWADTLKLSEVPENHGVLRGTKAEYCGIRLSPFLVKKASADGWIWTGCALKFKVRNSSNVQGRGNTDTLIFLADLCQTKFEHALKEPCSPWHELAL